MAQNADIFVGPCAVTSARPMHRHLHTYGLLGGRGPSWRRTPSLSLGPCAVTFARPVRRHFRLARAPSLSLGPCAATFARPVRGHFRSGTLYSYVCGAMYMEPVCTAKCSC